MFGFLNLNWVLHQQTFCILDPRRSVQRWGKKVSFSQWWRCTTSSSSHPPILHRKIKFPPLVCGEQFLSPPHKWAEVRCKDKAIIGVVTSVCGAPGGSHPLCLCKSLSCACPELPILVSRRDTIITPPLLNHSHYLTVTCLTCFSSCSAGPEGLDSIHFSALYSQLPCRCCVQAQLPAQTRRLPAVRIIKPGSLERDPVAAPAQCFSKLIVNLISGRKKSSGFGSSEAIRTQLCWQGRSK